MRHSTSEPVGPVSVIRDRTFRRCRSERLEAGFTGDEFVGATSSYGFAIEHSTLRRLHSDLMSSVGECPGVYAEDSVRDCTKLSPGKSWQGKPLS